jgi:hypothetical protein
MQQSTHTFQYPKVTPVAQSGGTPKPATSGTATPPPRPAR